MEEEIVIFEVKKKKVMFRDEDIYYKTRLPGTIWKFLKFRITLIYDNNLVLIKTEESSQWHIYHIVIGTNKKNLKDLCKSNFYYVTVSSKSWNESKFVIFNKTLTRVWFMIMMLQGFETFLQIHKGTWQDCIRDGPITN